MFRMPLLESYTLGELTRPSHREKASSIDLMKQDNSYNSNIVSSSDLNKRAADAVKNWLIGRLTFYVSKDQNQELFTNNIEQVVVEIMGDKNNMQANSTSHLKQIWIRGVSFCMEAGSEGVLISDRSDEVIS